MLRDIEDARSDQEERYAKQADAEVFDNCADELRSIADSLCTLYERKAEAELAIIQLRHLIENHIVMMTPEAGWSGKNAEEREVSKQRAILTSAGLDAMLAEEHSERTTMMLTEAAIAGAEARRRAIEWVIRAKFAPRQDDPDLLPY